jgi:hypothetical protein
MRWEKIIGDLIRLGFFGRLISFFIFYFFDSGYWGFNTCWLWNYFLFSLRLRNLSRRRWSDSPWMEEGYFEVLFLFLFIFWEKKKSLCLHAN